MTFGLPIVAAVAIAFPGEGARLPHLDRCYVIGSVPKGVKTVTVGTNEVEVYRTGAWSTMVAVVPGTNVVKAVTGDESAEVTFTVAPPPPPPPPKVETPGSAQAQPAAVERYPKLEYAKDAAKAPPTNRPPERITVVVDPGHGGSDTGALSPHAHCEKEANLLMALAVRDALAKRGYRVVMTRERDVALELYDRPKVAHANDADAFISIHHNAPPADRDPREFRYTAVFAWNEIGTALAKAVNRRMAEALAGEIRNNGVPHANFAVTRNPEIPSCLVEVDFLTSPEGEEAVWDGKRRLRLADAIARGFADWCGKVSP